MRDSSMVLWLPVILASAKPEECFFILFVLPLKIVDMCLNLGDIVIRANLLKIVLVALLLETIAFAGLIQSSDVKTLAVWFMVVLSTGISSHF